MDNHEEHLTDQQKRFVQSYCTGLSAPLAAKQAGYSKSYCRKASKLLKIPRVMLALAAIRENGRHLAAYTVAVAMAEANEAARFAREQKSPMAVVKATELRAKLSGLLIDRVEIAHVDILAALQKAEQRVLGVTDVPSVTSHKPHKPINWNPCIPGRRIAEEAGPADGESGSPA